jgi:transcriptional antiterminator NusG
MTASTTTPVVGQQVTYRATVKAAQCSGTAPSGTVEFKDGKRRRVRKKIFPGYVMVEMINTDDSWYVVRNTPGVTGFVSSGTRPVPLQEREVRSILRQMGLVTEKVRSDIAIGQPIKVITGPFSGFGGEVEEVHPERGKLRVRINMFGRETPVELDFEQITVDD